jgi:4a-hydroxytetrahydrobiopterin dehydratase
MTELTERKCLPCEGGVAPLSQGDAQALMSKLAPGWTLSESATHLTRDFRFKNYYRTMSFVNAVAHVANIEDHHPDLEVGYNHCRVTYSTHAIQGLSDNDFICAAKIDLIPIA